MVVKDDILISALIHLLSSIVKCQTRASRMGKAQFRVQRLATMVTRSNSDTIHI